MWKILIILGLYFVGAVLSLKADKVQYLASPDTYHHPYIAFFLSWLWLYVMWAEGEFRGFRNDRS